MSFEEINRIPENKAEVTVVGGGGAGLAAAVAAAEKGASVILLEKLGITGGSSAMAAGPFAVESPAQKRQRILTDKDDLFKKAMDWAHWKINPRIVRAFIDKSGDTINWLEARGLEFTVISHSPSDNPLTWHLSKGQGREIVQTLARECEKLGINLLTNTQAKKILKDANGNVNGITILKDGQEKTITTGSVIIATGGYAGNKELRKKYCPNYPESAVLRGLPNQGDGLAMAAEAGAATEGLGILLWGGPSPLNLAKPNGEQVSAPPPRFTQEPYLLWVNKKGKRYIDESAIMNSIYLTVNAVVRQPEGASFTLLDTGIIRKITQEGLIFGHSVEFANRLPEGWEADLKTRADQSKVKISDSWKEIADWIGADHETLISTINEYNNACDRGYDPVFTKDRRYLIPLRTAPYYAIKNTTMVLNTIGGIKINELMQVIDIEDSSIPGLYAAGVDTGGWVSDTYFSILPGTAFGFALNSGRIAGENAARYVLEKRC